MSERKTVTDWKDWAVSDDENDESAFWDVLLFLLILVGIVLQRRKRAREDDE